MGLFDKFRKPKEHEGTAPAGANVGAVVEDPVCHMKIQPSKAAGKSTHGETYYFCSSSCKAKFDRDPHAYLGAHGH